MVDITGTDQGVQVHEMQNLVDQPAGARIIVLVLPAGSTSAIPADAEVKYDGQVPAGKKFTGTITLYGKLENV
ncbi:MAG: hypothetical protein AB1349_01720 [Elusimicrobiota bacterium]